MPQEVFRKIEEVEREAEKTLAKEKERGNPRPFGRKNQYFTDMVQTRPGCYQKRYNRL